MYETTYDVEHVTNLYVMQNIADNLSSLTNIICIHEMFRQKRLAFWVKRFHLCGNAIPLKYRLKMLQQCIELISSGLCKDYSGKTKASILSFSEYCLNFYAGNTLCDIHKRSIILGRTYAIDWGTLRVETSPHPGSWGILLNEKWCVQLLQKMKPKVLGKNGPSLILQCSYPLTSF